MLRMKSILWFVFFQNSFTWSESARCLNMLSVSEREKTANVWLTAKGSPPRGPLIRKKQGYWRRDTTAERAIIVPYSFPKCAGGNLHRQWVTSEARGDTQKKMSLITQTFSYEAKLRSLLFMYETYSLTLLLYSGTPILRGTKNKFWNRFR